jgi:hypothetical protein
MMPVYLCHVSCVPVYAVYCSSQLGEMMPEEIFCPGAKILET